MREVRLQQEIVIRTEDQVGVLAAVSRLLCDMGINLLSVFVQANGETAAIHLVTSSQTYARDALRDAGYHVEQRDVVIVGLPHHPGFLCRISEALARKDLAINELYVTVPECCTTGVVVFTCTNNGYAVQLLRGK